MASAVLMGSQVKPRAVVIAFAQAQPRVMLTAHDPQRSRNVRIHLAPTHYHERSGSVAVLSL